MPPTREPTDDMCIKRMIPYISEGGDGSTRREVEEREGRYGDGSKKMERGS